MKFHKKLILPFSEVALQTRESLKSPYFPLPLSILPVALALRYGLSTRRKLRSPSTQKHSVIFAPNAAFRSITELKVLLSFHF
ncbi:unnamed protein product, partial [Vitis vinifera]